MAESLKLLVFREPSGDTTRTSYLTDVLDRAAANLGITVSYQRRIGDADLVCSNAAEAPSAGNEDTDARFPESKMAAPSRPGLTLYWPREGSRPAAARARRAGARQSRLHVAARDLSLPDFVEEFLRSLVPAGRRPGATLEWVEAAEVLSRQIGIIVADRDRYESQCAALGLEVTDLRRRVEQLELLNRALGEEFRKPTRPVVRALAAVLLAVLTGISAGAAQSFTDHQLAAAVEQARTVIIECSDAV